MTDEGSVAFPCLLSVKGVGVSSTFFGIVRRQSGQKVENSKALFESWHAELVFLACRMSMRPILGGGSSVPRSRRLHRRMNSKSKLAE
jgi:hypothetical protein